MQHIKLISVLVALVLGLLELWLLSLPPGAFALNYWPLRATLVYGTGVLAIGVMSIGVGLAARPVWFETALGGLDKFYRLHKWLGITALFLAVSHWALRTWPGWMAGLGMLTLPARPPRSDGGATDLSLLHTLREPAAVVGEWTFYLLIVLGALALWRRVSYTYFLKSHRVMAAVYLLLAFHAVVLMDTSYWLKPIGPVLGVLIGGAGFAAVLSLFRRIGYGRRAYGTISTLKSYEGNRVLEVGVSLATGWPGHDAGQYAFVSFDDREEAHPFTISSAWRNDGQLLFTIKELGDYTRTLRSALASGQAVVVEGPYGRFNFQGDNRRQIWIGGGVGLTPFIARMKDLAQIGHAEPIDLFYSTNAPAGDFIAGVRTLADKAGVHLHLSNDKEDGRLSFERLVAAVPDWKRADVWFCGPLPFGRALRGPMIAQGLGAGQFHQEIFEMR